MLPTAVNALLCPHESYSPSACSATQSLPTSPGAVPFPGKLGILALHAISLPSPSQSAVWGICLRLLTPVHASPDQQGHFLILKRVPLPFLHIIFPSFPPPAPPTPWNLLEHTLPLPALPLPSSSHPWVHALLHKGLGLFQELSCQDDH